MNHPPNVSRRLKFHLFVGDTNIYDDSDTTEDLTKKVKNEPKYVKRWLDTRKLSLIISKLTTSFFIPLQTLSHFAVKIGKKHIAKVKCIKFLGALLDEHLTWRYRITKLSKNWQEPVAFCLRLGVPSQEAY